MRLRQLVRGVASGYAAKGVQFGAAVAIVPFLLREDVLGIEGYGTAFTILSLTGIPPLLIDGLRLSFIRRISQSIDREQETPVARTGALVGTGVRVLLAATTLLAAVVVAAGDPLLDLAGIEVRREMQIALALGALLFWVENVLVLFRVPLTARGDLAALNLFTILEVVLRTAAYFVYFSLAEATITSFVLIQLVFTTLRAGSIAVYLAVRWPGDLSGFSQGRWVADRSLASYSVPATVFLSTNQLMARVPIILANRLLGPTESGLLALVLDTMRRYVIQILFSVVQPVAVPIASRLDPRTLTDGSRALLWNLEALYAGTVALAVTSIIAAMPLLVDLWLGEELLVVSVPAQLMMLACAVEIAYTIRQSIVIPPRVSRGDVAITRILPIRFAPPGDRM